MRLATVPVYALAIVYAGFAVWLLPFLLIGWSRKSPQKRDPRARWGLVLQTAGYMILSLGQFVQKPLPAWRIGLSVLFLALASALSWTSTRALGRFLRFGAALDADHELVRSGAYRVVRHPIYASMLCLFLGFAAIIATPLLFVTGLIVFVTGIEIRVRVEDGLLAERFGAEFDAYQRSTPAYVPFLR